MIFLQAAGFANTFSSLAKYGLWGIIGFLLVIVFIIIVGAISIWQWQRKKWYLTVVLKMPRDGNKTIVTEVAKGSWNARKATLWVKRKGLTGSKFFVQLDDIRSYLQGNETIELIGSGINWKPILFQSYFDVIDEETGKEASIMKYAMNFNKDKAWALRAEREYINTFSVSDMFNKLKDYIGWGIVIFIVILAEVVRVAYVGK